MDNMPELIPTNPNGWTESLIRSYEEYSGQSLSRADPRRAFLLWVASLLLQERVLANRAALRNIPRYADGEYLDTLGELFHDVQRLAAVAAKTTMRFYVSEQLPEPITIPSGTKVTTEEQIVFETTEAATVAAGDLYVDVPAICQTPGNIGNGFAPGRIAALIDVYPYYERCENITTSEGGSDTEADANFYERMIASMDSYSTAGPRGAYIYHAMSTSALVVDVEVDEPGACQVDVYPLLIGGKLPGEELLSAIADRINTDTVRPMGDLVRVLPPDVVNYDINIVYYLPQNALRSAESIEHAVATAINDYTAWQSTKLGRNINPSKLVAVLMQTGIERVEVISPVVTAVGKNAIARVGSIIAENGGIDDD